MPRNASLGVLPVTRYTSGARGGEGRGGEGREPISSHSLFLVECLHLLVHSPAVVSFPDHPSALVPFPDRHEAFSQLLIHCLHYS